ncbi:MAG: ribosome small subunit-dependent GTPase A [Alphaproteobacteria bacterium]|nr:ribosome small subunit-dependent GTPase A [Alphaproteobacteria bacterium]
MSLLDSLGWSAFVATLDPSSSLFADHVPARVAIEHKGRFEVLTEAGRLVVPAPTAPDTPPKVGDWVLLSPGDPPTVHTVLPRRRALIRSAPGGRGRQVLATHVDEVWILTSANRDFKVRRLERYLAATLAAEATPVVVLTKIDLAMDAMGRLVRAARDVAPGVDVHAVSTLLDLDVDTLQARLQPGRTVALVGSSGVGKSTLLNRLLGDEAAATGAIRDDDARGRHTTTHRHLHLVPGGRGAIVDMPGLRELGLADPAGLASAFADVEALAEACRFRDCAHDGEPGCAVQAAVDDGTLDAARLASWHKLHREAEAAARRDDVAKARAWARQIGARNRRILSAKKERGW